MSVITPTIGRKVWFWPPTDSDGGMNIRSRQQALDATVVYVHNDSVVNLQVNDHDGKPHSFLFVDLFQGSYEERPTDRWCATWMPYQQGQARKAEPDPRPENARAG